MLPLFDMIAKAQNGDAFNLMAKQFGLSAEQTQQAVEALMPAFSEGLKRNATNPWDVGNFMQALAGGGHQKYFEDVTQAMSGAGMSEGNGILGHLFGSKELSRAVAQQAAAQTGIGQDILKQMLPVLASTIMGGLFKQSTGQMQAAAMGNNPFAEVIEQMMRQSGGQRAQPEPQPRAQAPDPMADNPFGKILQDMFGGALGGQPQSAPQRAPQQTPSRGQNPLGDNPWGKMLEEMMGGGRAQPQAREPEPQRNPSGRARTPYDDLFGKMFDSGAQVRDGYQKNMESIFDQYMSGMERNARR